MSTGKEADIDGAVVEGGVGATTGGKDPTLATLGLVEGLEADLAGMLSEVRVVARSFHYAAVYADALTLPAFWRHADGRGDIGVGIVASGTPACRGQGKRCHQR